jgi:hypothetical protein
MDMEKKKKLSKLSMPERRAPEEMELMEFEGEEPEMEMPESEEMELEMDKAPAEEALDAQMSAAADLSDDELLAEIKKRGLTADLGEEEAEEAEQEMYS